MMSTCSALQILSVRHNRLEELPPELARLGKLETLLIDANKTISAFPVEYKDLTSLRRLDLDVDVLGTFPQEVLNWVTQLTDLNYKGTKK